MPPNLPDSDLDEGRSPTPVSDMEDIQPSVPQTQIETTDIKNQTDEESTKVEMGSKKRKRAPPKELKKTKPEPDELANSDGDDDEEDVFEVEKVVEHKFQGKKCLYRVRWVGWGANDDTWETAENLSGSFDLLAKYQNSIGGEPQPPKSARKIASKSTLKEKLSTSKGLTSDDGSSPTPKRARRPNSKPIEPNTKDWHDEDLGSWLPSDKAGNWEDLIHLVETVERDESGNLFAYIRFKNGRRTKVANSIYVQRCPRKMLAFYESHLSV